MVSPLDQIQQHCARQLAAYQSCVSTHPHSWSVDCNLERRALTDCSEDKVDAVRAVKKKCDGEVRAYDGCLKENDGQPRACLAALKSLYECARQNAPQPLAIDVPPPPPASTAQ
ncbi:hypothetical protein PYCC9005_002959 [Savitreella phatthalungensis]